MNEQSLCAFVERWNQRAEAETVYEPFLYIVRSYKMTLGAMKRPSARNIVSMLDDLMATHDSDAPQWVEASAVASDGTRYWARVDARSEIPFIGPLAAIGFAKHVAQGRAEYLANTRGGAAS